MQTQQEIKQRINRSALEEILKSRDISQADLADKIGAQPKSFNRWINEGYIHTQFVWDLTEALNLSEAEMDRVLLSRRYQVFFRKKFLGEVPKEIQEKAIELAQTFFGLTYLNSSANFCAPNLSKVESPEEVANQIRRYLDISSFSSLQSIVTKLAERGVEVAVVPFKKLGLCSDGDYECAFSVTDGSRFVIFLDASSPEEGLIFFLCHEISHLFRPDLDFSKIEERFCNEVAAELIYPRAFFEAHRKHFQNVIDSGSIVSINSMITAINENLGGEPFGICLRLKSFGLFSQKDKLHSSLINFAERTYKQSEKLEAKYFQDFDAGDRKKFAIFWNKADLSQNAFLRFFAHIKNGVEDESLSARRFSDLFSLDFAVADELARAWRFELHQNLKQIANG